MKIDKRVLIVFLLILVSVSAAYFIESSKTSIRFNVCNKDGSDCRLNAKFSSLDTCMKYSRLYDYDDCREETPNPNKIVCNKMDRIYIGVCQ